MGLIGDNWIVKACTKTSYQASCNSLEEEASNDGADELGNPVEDPGEDRDLASKSQSKGDGRIDMATGDVCSHGDGNEERKPVANGDSHKSSRI